MNTFSTNEKDLIDFNREFKYCLEKKYYKEMLNNTFQNNCLHLINLVE